MKIPQIAAQNDKLTVIDLQGNTSKFGFSIFDNIATTLVEKGFVQYTDDGGARQEGVPSWSLISAFSGRLYCPYGCGTPPRLLPSPPSRRAVYRSYTPYSHHGPPNR